MLIKDLIERFNTAANTAFNKGYQELEPGLKDLSYDFMSGDVSSVDFPIVRIMSKIKKFLGNRIHNSPADSFLVTIRNEEFDGSVDIPRRDLKRAMAVNSITGLDMFVKDVESLGKEAKDLPYEDVLDMIEAGHLSTYGTTFDGQNMFDTTHAFENVAGTQSNILTGTGSTVALATADLNKAISALRGFYYSMDVDGGNSKKRKLNKTMKLKIICPDQLVQIFETINKAEYLNNETNTLKGMVSEVIGRPFTDLNDWYLFEVSESNVKPFIISMEEVAKLEMPEASDFQLREHKVLTWGLEGFSYGKGYGAWWKAVKTTNS